MPIEDKNIKILIIDDMKSMREIIKYNLEQFDFKNVYDIEDPVQALELIRKTKDSPFELIICDYNMPKITGLELVAQLRQDDQFRAVPVLVVIAPADKRLADDILTAGASAYIVKPFTKEQLHESLLKIHL